MGDVFPIELNIHYQYKTNTFEEIDEYDHLQELDTDL